MFPKSGKIDSEVFNCHEMICICNIEHPTSDEHSRRVINASSRDYALSTRPQM